MKSLKEIDLESYERNLTLLTVERIAKFGKGIELKMDNLLSVAENIEISAMVEDRVVMLYITRNYDYSEITFTTDTLKTYFKVSCLVDYVTVFDNFHIEYYYLIHIICKIENAHKTDKKPNLSNVGAFEFIYPTLEEDDLVIVPDPTSDDDWNHEFEATFVEYDDDGYAIVVDGVGDYWNVEPYRLKKSD